MKDQKSAQEYADECMRNLAESDAAETANWLNEIHCLYPDVGIGLYGDGFIKTEENCPEVWIISAMIVMTKKIRENMR